MKELKTEHLNNRLDIIKKNDNGVEISCVVDNNPPVVIIPFLMDNDNKVIQQVFLHEYIDMFDELITTVININQWNFDVNIDVVKTFISKYFSIPESKIELDRIFYLGESQINFSLFKSTTVAYGINLSGLLREDEIKKQINGNPKDNLIRVSYYDVLKGHYLDNMIMSTTFQLMSYFMI